MPIPEGSIFDSAQLLFCNTLAGPSTSQLILIPPESRRDGDICWVESVGAPYIFRENSAEPVDGILVIAPVSGTGQWVSIVSIIAPAPMLWGAQSLPGGSSFFFKPSSDSIGSFEHTIQMNSSRIVKGLRVIAEVPPGSGATDTFVVRKNGIDTGLSVSLSDLETEGFVNNVLVFFVEGDTISLRGQTDPATSIANVLVTLEVY